MPAGEHGFGGEWTERKLESVSKYLSAYTTALKRKAFRKLYGMPVEWSTIEAIAGTQAIDLWYLFPLSAVNRCLARSGRIDPSWESALDRTLGAGDWRTAFYRESGQISLFGGDGPGQEKVADWKLIEQYVRRRLEAIFEGGVAKRALPLCNSRESCMFLLFFACANPSPKANGLALKFANAILKP